MTTKLQRPLTTVSGFVSTEGSGKHGTSAGGAEGERQGWQPEDAVPGGAGGPAARRGRQPRVKCRKDHGRHDQPSIEYHEHRSPAAGCRQGDLEGAVTALRSGLDRPVELQAAHLDCPLGRALLWMHRNLVMDVAEGSAAVGERLLGEQDDASAGAVPEGIEQEHLGRDPRAATYGPLLERRG